VAATAVLLLGACGTLSPSRYVSSRTDPPPEVARAAAEAAAAPTPAPGPRAPTQPPQAPAAPRSLADLVDLALSRDPTTRAAWHDARAAAAQAGAQRSLYWPTIDASASMLRQRTGGGSGRDATTSTTGGVSASLTWLLLDLGPRSALVDSADRLLVAARLAEHTAVADLVLAVQQTYFQYLGARALAAAAAAAVRQAETSLAAAEGRRSAGVATIADVLQARTALSQVRLSLQQSEGQALALRGALATLAGLPPTAELEVGALPAEVDAARARPSVDQLLAAAAAKNPELGQARALADAADARARAASRAAWPTLSFQASGGRTHFVAPEGIDPITIWSAGLVLRVPIFEGSRRRTTRSPRGPPLTRPARAPAPPASALGSTSGPAIRVCSPRGPPRDRPRSRRLRARRPTWPAAGTRRVGSILDLLAAQAALETAHAEDVRARSDYLVSLARLTRASGHLDLPAAAPHEAPAAEATGDDP
jgi:outer membrane protein TolC